MQRGRGSGLFAALTLGGSLVVSSPRDKGMEEAPVQHTHTVHTIPSLTCYFSFFPAI